MATEWIMVRVSRSTRARLNAIGERLMRSGSVDEADCPRMEGTPSVDAIVRRLCDADDAHQRRARRQKGKRAKGQSDGAARP